MHFEFIRGGQVPPRKTANLSSPARDRLVPLRDLASLFGCTEEEIAKWALCLTMSLEPLDWRGSQVLCLTLENAFQLHLAIRAMAEGPSEIVDLRTRELRMTLKAKEGELVESHGRALELEQRVAHRDQELQALMRSVAELEQTVAKRADALQELVGVQKLYVDSQAQQSELVLKLSNARRDTRLSKSDQDETRESVQQLQHEVAQKQAVMHGAKQRINQLEVLSEQQARDLAAAEKRAAAANISAIQAQSETKDVARLRSSRQRSARKLNSLRRRFTACRMSEENLERYSDRLEQRLRDRG